METVKTIRAKSTHDLHIQIVRSEQLRKYKDAVKGTLNDRMNAELCNLYEEMMPLSSKVPVAELNRFLLCIRQNSDGYTIKTGYVNLSVECPMGDPKATLTASLGSIWNPLLSHRKILTKPWEKTLVIPFEMMVEKRKIVIAYKPLMKETCDYIRDCWRSLINKGKWDGDQYHEIAKIKFNPVDLVS